jgi:hypothetical protein
MRGKVKGKPLKEDSKLDKDNKRKHRQRDKSTLVQLLEIIN